jgi:hypothetical protein
MRRQIPANLPRADYFFETLEFAHKVRLLVSNIPALGKSLFKKTASTDAFDRILLRMGEERPNNVLSENCRSHGCAANPPDLCLLEFSQNRQFQRCLASPDSFHLTEIIENRLEKFS